MIDYITATEIRQHQKEAEELFGTLLAKHFDDYFRILMHQVRNILNINLNMTRPTIDEVMLRCAYNFSHRSTCIRRKVGCVITTHDRLQILGVGYNGNAKGLPNHCDCVTPGDCGCIHAELNALLKAPGTLPNKVLYTTTAPCLECAKLILNSNVIEVIYAETYRTTCGIDLLRGRNVLVRQLYIPPWRIEPTKEEYTVRKMSGDPLEP